ncbi:MAG: NlpC/P60 family protein [Fuerstiella sp.]
MSREAVIQVARRVEQSGAHYLTYTFGAMPGQADGITGRFLSLVNDLNWPTLAVKTAEFNHLRCVGRYAKVNGERQNRPTSRPPTSGDLAVWLESARGAPEFGPLHEQPQLIRNRIPGIRGVFYPRRHVIHRSHCPSRQEEDTCSPNFVYLGESCVGKLHFDCVGFICYVFTEALGRQVRYGLNNWPAQGREIELQAVQPGDLILWPGHIALVESNSGRLRIVHANGDRRGVESTPLPSGVQRNTIQAIHLPDGFFR